ncbi:hypothetical protein [Treponema sp.]|uniref:hypothetical protein n=1 Tax=Treponema sp. TaxID=166 RepID=UPI003FD6FE61
MNFLDYEVPDIVELPPIRNEKGQIVKHVKLNFSQLINDQRCSIENLIENMGNSIREENAYTEIYSILANIEGIEELDSIENDKDPKYVILFQEIISGIIRLLSCCNFIINQKIYDPAIVLKIITFVSFILELISVHKNTFTILQRQDKQIHRLLRYILLSFNNKIYDQINLLTGQNIGILFNSNPLLPLPWYYGNLFQNNCNIIQYLHGFQNRISFCELTNQEIETQDKDNMEYLN